MTREAADNEHGAAMRPKIDFYVLSPESGRKAQSVVIKLCEKALQQGLPVLISCDDAEQLSAVRFALWHEDPVAYLPHWCEGDADMSAPIGLHTGSAEPWLAHCTKGLWLPAPSQSLAANWQQAMRIAEVVTQAPQSLAASRQRYRLYRAAGCEPETHSL